MHGRHGLLAGLMLAALTTITPVVAAGSIFIDLGRGPVEVVVPSTYDPRTPTPLIFLLHGYQTTSEEIEDWLQFAPLTEEYGFILVLPNGDTDLFGLQYWNATPDCCDIFGENPDDSGYLRALHDEIAAQLNIDERRVYFTGHSNGGFMSYRMACDHADIVAAVASLAGATFTNPNDCVPSVAVDVLQIHGTNDGVIFYNGGNIILNGFQIGAVATVETWAMYDNCDMTTETLSPIDLVVDITGAETTRMRYADNCDPGGSAELWTMAGAVHSPNFNAEYGRTVVEFLLDHPKPVKCPVDLDGDDTVGTTDLLALLGAWGTSPGGPPDYDGGGVGVTDLLVLLGGWGTCE